MTGKTQAEALAAYAVHASYDMLSAPAREQLAIRVLDSLGCALAAVDGEPVRHVRAQVDEFGCPGPCALIGGGTAAPDRAALYNTALVRYLDFMDAFMAQGETCHPSDNFGSLLAAADYAGAPGRDFLAALALAYHVQCRLTEAAPVMEQSLDHVAQLAFSIAAGVSRLLGMDERQTTNALALCGCQSLALTISRASPGTNWKGLASSATALACVSAIFLARRDVTGPAAVFEGIHGFMQATDTHIAIAWKGEGLDAVTRTNIKAYNAERTASPPSKGCSICAAHMASPAQMSPTSRLASSRPPLISSAAANIATEPTSRPRSRRTTAYPISWPSPHSMAMSGPPSSRPSA